LLSASLAVTSLVVALFINRIEPPGFAPEFPLPWDPTHTGRKYLVLAGLGLIGAYVWWLYQPSRGRIVLLPALLLTLAMPLGAAGYESVANYWGWTAWMEGDPDKLAELQGDPYAYLADPNAKLTTVVLVREDTLQLGRLAMNIAGGDPGGLQGAAERKAQKRTLIGWGLLVIAVGLVAGAAWQILQTKEHIPPSSSPTDPNTH